MSSTEPSTRPTAKQASSYNQAATTIAEQIQRHRKSIASSSKLRERTREELFPAYNRAGLGVALEYERMGNRPVSDSLANRANALGLELEHIGLTLGTVIHNIDLRQALTKTHSRFVRDTLLERKVIFFRNQHLAEDEQVAFAKQFGPLDAFPFGKPGSNPFILEIQHDANSPGAENGWHTDVTWMENPSLGSVAQCMEVPPFGGDTLFADSHACYLGLPPELSAQLEQLQGIHDYRIFLPAQGPSAYSEQMTASIKANIPFGVSHPLLRTHPETGKTALYLHGGFLRHESLHNQQTGETLDPSSSKRLVTALLTQHARPEYQCRFQWQPGSIAFWDNRAVQHYAASDYYPHKRLLRRVTVSGDTPYYQPGQPEQTKQPTEA